MRPNILNTENGFTLIEALTAMVVLSIGIFSLYSMQITSIRGNSHADRITTASTWNADQVEGMVGMQYNDATLADTDGDGTGQDTDAGGDGIDDDGDGFGLDDVQCCPNGNDPVGNAVAGCTDKADGCNDNSGYYIYWNVAVDVPMDNLKTIRVHVQDNRQVLSRPVVFTYIKNDII